MCVCSHGAVLVVQRGDGSSGVWRFPLQFACTEVAPVGVVRVEATALHKDACTELRVCSETE